MQIQHIGVVGAGQMGNGIAHVFAVAGYDVLLTDISQDALNKAVEAERERADGYSRQVIALLEATPPVTHTVRELTRAYPSPCVRPAPVTDGLHQALSRANQAIAAAGGNGALPADAGEAVKPDGR